METNYTFITCPKCHRMYDSSVSVCESCKYDANDTSHVQPSTMTDAEAEEQAKG